MDYIENRTFDEIQIGETASLARTLSKADIALFAVMSGDVNPAHLDEEFARSDLFHKIVAHGMWGGALISTLLGTILPGPGTIYLGQTLRFRRPVSLGDTITVTVTAKAKDAEKRRVTFDCQCINQNGEMVISGEAEVLAPAEKIKRPRIILPEVHLHDHHAWLNRLLSLAEGLAPIRTAVVHPVDAHALGGAVAAAASNVIEPVLIGPEARIRAAANAANVDIAGYPIISTEHSHAAAAQAVTMAQSGEVEALMRGSLRTQELMDAVVARGSGLRTARRMSHVFAVDVPTYAQLLFITDAMINIEPDLDAKRDIVQNAIDLAHVLGIETPKVAILSAIEQVHLKIRSSMDAAALCKMVDRQQITGGVVDGPLSFDTAISETAASAHGIGSPVAGRADILVAPDLETGTMLVEQLEYLAEGQAAGVVLGARVPIIITDGLPNVRSQVASCALALMLARRRLRRE
jgi:phosphate acetyltransferase/phosphate butyryltransferase